MKLIIITLLLTSFSLFAQGSDGTGIGGQNPNFKEEEDIPTRIKVYFCSDYIEEVAKLEKSYLEKHNIKYILNGGNISTECVRNPMEWLYYGTDMAQIKDLINKFGTLKLETYPFSSVLKHKFYLRYLKGVKVIKMLNYRPYIKKDALELLKKEYGWKPYPQKHFESRFTKFYEGYWLPERFGFDTRRVQYSSLILTNQMTRDEALEKLSRPAYNPETIEDEFNYIATKLGITSQELQSYFKMTKKFYWDYKNQETLFNFGAKILKAIGVERSIKR
jgi:hypothetical protein